MSNRATCRDHQKSFKAGNRTARGVNHFFDIGHRLHRCVRRVLWRDQYEDRKEAQAEARRKWKESQTVAREAAKKQREQPGKDGLFARIKRFFQRKAA
jgi:hypothetical protein